MSDTRLAQSTRQASANAAVDQLDASAGTLRVYSGLRPDPDSPNSGNLLIQWTLPVPGFGAANAAGTADRLGGTLVAAVTGTGTQTAGYMSVNDNAGAILWTGTVGTIGSGADLELTSLSLTNGQNIDQTAYSYTQPEQ